MMKRKGFLVGALSLAVLLGSGCANQQRYDYSAIEKSKPRSILVVPPTNDSVEVDAPYIYLSTLSKPLAEKGYYVFPVAVIDQFLRENGLPTPAEMNNVPLDKFAEHIGPDAVLYVNIEDWGQKYQLLSSTTVVRANLKLVDTNNGELLWESTAFHQQGSGDGGGGLAGMLAAAVVEQVVGSMVDKTPEVARFANVAAINNRNTGLPAGPYKVAEPK